MNQLAEQTSESCGRCVIYALWRTSLACVGSLRLSSFFLISTLLTLLLFAFEGLETGAEDEDVDELLVSCDAFKVGKKL